METEGPFINTEQNSVTVGHVEAVWHLIVVYDYFHAQRSEEHMGQVTVDQNSEACGTGACRGLSAGAQQMTGSLCRAKDGCGVLGQSKCKGMK